MNVRHSATALSILLLFTEFSFVIFKVKDLRPGGTVLSVVRKLPLNRPKSFRWMPNRILCPLHAFNTWKFNQHILAQQLKL